MTVAGRFFVLVGVVLMGLSCGGETPVRSGEINVFVGPRFWTGDRAQPWAEALVVDQGRIVALATRAEVPRLIANGGAVRELPGRLALPGLTDAHGHLLGYALARRRADLVGAATMEETLARVERFAAEHADARWVIGRGWDQNDWPDRAWPDADRLEQVVAGRPCALWRVDGHAVWVNRTALAAVRIDRDTPDPPGGKIRRDSAGRPTGVLIDEAAEMVARTLPEPSDSEVESALAEAAGELLALGLTGIHDMDVERRGWDAMRKLADSGRLPLRVTAYAALHGDLAPQLFARGPVESGRLRLVGVKLYADGALGSRGARLMAPYHDDPGNRGLWITRPQDLAATVLRALKAGLQPAIHAIGDEANRAAIDSYRAALQAEPNVRELRGRVEHAQVLAPEDIPRLAQYGIVASMQPTHATSDMPWAEDRLGADRLAGAYAWRSVLDSGAHLAFGSDYPVESPDPLRGLYAAVTRQDDRGRPPDGWAPAQRLTLAEAIGAFTLGAAYAAHQEQDLGTLARGRWCDLTILDRNPFDESPRALLETRVVATVIGGQVAFTRKE